MVLSGEVEIIHVSSSVALSGHIASLANFKMVAGQADGLLQVEGSFDKGGNEARDNMPLDMAMEEPDA